MVLKYLPTMGFTEKADETHSFREAKCETYIDTKKRNQNRF